MQKSLGKKIKQLRITKGMTQGELGSGLVTPSMISQIEADKASPSNKLLSELAERLGVTLQYFVQDIQTKMEKSSTLKYARMLMDSANYRGASQILANLLDSSVPHVQKQEIQLDLAYSLYKLGKTQDALNVYESIIQESMGTNEPSYVVKALIEMGQIEYVKGNFVLAHFHWSKASAIGVRDLSTDNELTADVFLKLANVQNKLGDYSEALESLRKVRSLLSKTSDLIKAAVMTRITFEVYRNLGDTEKAMDYAREALAMYKNLNRPSDATKIKITIAELSHETAKSEEALTLLKQCLESDNPEVLDDIQYVHAVMAEIYLALGDFHAARNHCQEALAVVDNDHDTQIKAYRLLSEIDFAQEQYPEAIFNCEQVIHLCQKQNRIADLTRAFTQLSKIYKKQGNFMSAADTFLRMHETIENNLREKTVLN